SLGGARRQWRWREIIKRHNRSDNQCRKRRPRNILFHGHWNEQRPIRSREPSRGITSSTATAICAAIEGANAAISTVHFIWCATLTSGRKSRSPEAITRTAGGGVVAIIKVPCATNSVSTAFSLLLASRSCVITVKPPCSAIFQTASCGGGR